MSILDEFISGQKACRDGRACPDMASEAFVRGFAAEYELEQTRTYRSEHEHI